MHNSWGRGAVVVKRGSPIHVLQPPEEVRDPARWPQPVKRVAKLYLPSGSKDFGSREAYALTYTSCQASGK